MDEKTLDGILIGMQEQTTSGDWEMAHYKADDYLKELVELLSRTLTIEERSKVQAILEAYEEVGKWYA